MQYGLEQNARQYEIQQQEAARQNETRLQLNPRLNSILDLCLKSLPNGIQSVIKDLVTQVCAANNGQLDMFATSCPIACKAQDVDSFAYVSLMNIPALLVRKTNAQIVTVAKYTIVHNFHYFLVLLPQGRLFF